MSGGDDMRDGGADLRRMVHRKRVAVCHPYLARGGSEARALWLLQALREEYDTTLLTLGPIDLPQLNAYYGTSLRDTDFATLRPRTGSLPLRPGMASDLRGAMFERHLRRSAGQFDLLISAYNPMPFGRPGIHFVADFSWLPDIRRELHGETSSLRAQGGPRALLRGVHDALVRLVRGGVDQATPVPGDAVIANSRYVQGILRERLDLHSHHVIYPPVSGPTGGLPWEERATAFLSIGRISKEKRIEDQIEILRRVRERGFAVRLSILGGPLESAYARSLRSRVRETEDWVSWRGWVCGDEKWELLQSHRFAIHACRGEAFGISTAEMVRTGCIPFVPVLGGPIEIVREPGLQYTHEDDAVEKIIAVLQDEPSQAALSRRLQQRGAAFGTRAFTRAVRPLVAEMLLTMQQEGA